MGKRTPFYELHVAAGAKMVDFAGWDMPIHYGSQVNEHHQVRQDAGVFDVSHMRIVDLVGDRSREFLRYLLANNVDKLQKPGKALYTCMLNERGGVIDDLIVYFLRNDLFRAVVNAATAESDIAWIKDHAGKFGVVVQPRPELAMLAIQGPNARRKVHAALGSDLEGAAEGLKPFSAVQVDDLFVARTGYTGEDGYEIMFPSADAAVVWQSLLNEGVKPIGLGARDTLRLEAGMNLYGTDMDENTTPLEAGLGWTVGWEPADRDFIGRTALETQRESGTAPQFVGLVLLDKGVLRNHQKVMANGRDAGEITSGSFSPTLGRGIALARIDVNVQDKVQLEMRGKSMDARVVRPPFVRNGKVRVEI